jgi:hypothetical protein
VQLRAAGVRDLDRHVDPLAGPRLARRVLDVAVRTDVHLIEVRRRRGRRGRLGDQERDPVVGLRAGHAVVHRAADGQVVPARGQLADRLLNPLAAEAGDLGAARPLVLLVDRERQLHPRGLV